MKFISPPKHDCILEATEHEAREISVNTGGFIVRHEAWFILVYGKWLMILPKKEMEKDGTVQGPKRDKM